MNKEQVYDAAINPLMLQIIETCKAHGIAMIASFSIPTPEDTGLRCTSILPDETGKNDVDHKRALRLLRDGASDFTAIITSIQKEGAE